jgi:hypothetical protein
LGIRVERVEPGKRQQNFWRREFNEERLHEALGQKPPATVYHVSSRKYPRKLIRPEPERCAEVSRVGKSGFITWRRRKIFITSALAHELVELDVDYLTDTCEARVRIIPGTSAQRHR